MNTNSQKWLNLISAVLLFIGGFILLFNPFKGIIAIEYCFTTLYILLGSIQVFSYFRLKRVIEGISSWLLWEGIIDIIFGCLVYSTLFADFRAISSILTFSYVIAYWIMFRSIAQIIKSFQMKKINISNWWILLCTGLLGILISILGMNNPIIFAYTISQILAMYFIIYAVSALYSFFTNK